jgi:hypothetical protein
VEVNGAMVYSKLKLGRHAQAGEVSELVRQVIEKGRG